MKLHWHFVYINIWACFSPFKMINIFLSLLFTCPPVAVVVSWRLFEPVGLKASSSNSKSADESKSWSFVAAYRLWCNRFISSTVNVTAENIILLVNQQNINFLHGSGFPVRIKVQTNLGCFIQADFLRKWEHCSVAEVKLVLMSQECGD